MRPLRKPQGNQPNYTRVLNVVRKTTISTQKAPPLLEVHAHLSSAGAATGDGATWQLHAHSGAQNDRQGVEYCSKQQEPH